MTSAPSALLLAGNESERAYWRARCAALGDPVRDEDIPEAVGLATAVAFDDRTIEFGLPAKLVTSSASVGTLGDRVALFVPGATNATRMDAGTSAIEVFVRCGHQFHAIDLRDRVKESQLDRLPPSEAVTSGIWDADGDGRNDLIIPIADDTNARYYVAVMYNEGDGSFLFRQTLEVPLEATMNTVTPIDLNHDGVLDLYGSMMGEDFHRAVAGIGDEQARDELALYGANRRWKRVTGEIPGLTGPGDLTTFSFVCVPAIPDVRRKVCWIGTGHVANFVLEELGPMSFRLLDVELPPNATMGVTVMDSPGAEKTTFVATNIGRPLVVEIDRGLNIAVVSEQVPMEVVKVGKPKTTDSSRGRVGWGAAADAFNSSGCPGLVVGNSLINSLAWLPIHEGSGLLYYERNCGPEAPHGTQFVDKTATAGPAFGDTDIRDYFQTLVVHANDDLCPDLVVTAYPRDPDDVNELMHDPTPFRLLVNRCDTAGRRLAFRLVPEDYDARIVVRLDDGTDLHGYLSQPSQAGTNGTTVSFGLGERTATRACVHWGKNTRWPDRGPQCVDSPSTRRVTTVIRATE